MCVVCHGVQWLLAVFAASVPSLADACAFKSSSTVKHQYIVLSRLLGTVFMFGMMVSGGSPDTITQSLV
jgi:hypothetical protein